MILPVVEFCMNCFLDAGHAPPSEQKLETFHDDFERLMRISFLPGKAAATLFTKQEQEAYGSCSGFGNPEFWEFVEDGLERDSPAITAALDAAKQGFYKVVNDGKDATPELIEDLSTPPDARLDQYLTLEKKRAEVFAALKKRTGQ